MNRTFARGLGGVLLVSVVAACGGEEERAAGDDVSPQECVTDLVELTDGDISAAELVERCDVSAAEAEAAVPPAPTASEAEPTTTTTTTTEVVVVEDTEPVPPPTASAAEPVAVMPDIPCGTDLQLAQDLVQEAGVFFSRSEDATGQDRSQVMDRNWTVVLAEPPGGMAIGEDEAVFYVVKDEEFEGC